MEKEYLDRKANSSTTKHSFGSGLLDKRLINKCKNFPDGCSINCKHYNGMYFTDENLNMKIYKELPKSLEDKLGSESEGDIIDLFK